VWAIEHNLGSRFRALAELISINVEINVIEDPTSKEANIPIEDNSNLPRINQVEVREEVTSHNGSVSLVDKENIPMRIHNSHIENPIAA